MKPDAKSLEDVLSRARSAPFYRERLADADAGNWERIPLTTKDDLRAAYPFGLLAVPLSAVATYHESSGTSGLPTASAFTDADWDDIAGRFARNAVNLRPGDMVLVKTPYAMVTTAHQMHRAARLCGATVVPADNRSSVMPYARVVRLLSALPITVAWCLPTEALLWAEAARRAGLNPAKDFPDLRAFCVAGEPLALAKRRRISDEWGGVPVFEDYGSTETGSLGGECTQGRLHLWSDRIHFEVVDGGLVVTPLFREAMPLVRYATGDDVELETSHDCPCGSPFPTARVRGRAGADFRCGNRAFSATEIETQVYSLPVHHGVLFYRAQVRGDTLHVEVAARPATSHVTVATLTTLISERLGLPAVVRVVATETLVSERLFTEEVPFQKPRFVFHEHEDWNQAITYGGRPA